MTILSFVAHACDVSVIYVTMNYFYWISVSYFNDVCFYTMMGGLLSSFLSGIVYDWQKKRCKSKLAYRTWSAMGSENENLFLSVFQDIEYWQWNMRFISSKSLGLSKGLEN